MKITKYTHACIVLEEQGQRLVIDPGAWSNDLTDFKNIVGVVITHDHFDHCNPQLVQAILSENPDTKVYTTQKAADQLGGQQVQVVTNGQTAQVGKFMLAFYGEWHAIVYGDQPHTQNVGVLVNNSFYYPGDSLTNPNVPVKILALPVSGPWLKTDESIRFMVALKPAVAIPTHDALFSPEGTMINDNWFKPVAEAQNTNFRRLNPGESIDV